jgi:hypothetical protein
VPFDVSGVTSLEARRLLKSSAPTLIGPSPTVGQPWTPMVQIQLTGKDGRKPHGHFSYDGNVTQSKAKFSKSTQRYFFVSPETPHTYTQPGQYDVYLLLQHGDSFRSIKFTVNVS